MRGFILLGLLCISAAIGGDDYNAEIADSADMLVGIISVGFIMDFLEFIKKLEIV